MKTSTPPKSLTRRNRFFIAISLLVIGICWAGQISFDYLFETQTTFEELCQTLTVKVPFEDCIESGTFSKALNIAFEERVTTRAEVRTILTEYYESTSSVSDDDPYVADTYDVYNIRADELDEGATYAERFVFAFFADTELFAYIRVED